MGARGNGNGKRGWTVIMAWTLIPVFELVSCGSKPKGDKSKETRGIPHSAGAVKSGKSIPSSCLNTPPSNYATVLITPCLIFIVGVILLYIFLYAPRG